MSQSAQATAELQGLPAYIIPGTWQAPTTSRNPIVVDRQIRGSLQFVTGKEGDRLTDIIGSRLQYGMLVYVENDYTVGDYVRYKNSYYCYQKQILDAERSTTTGQLPNSEANWSLFSRLRNYSIFVKYTDQEVRNGTFFSKYTNTPYDSSAGLIVLSSITSAEVVTVNITNDSLFYVNVSGTYLIKMHNTFSPGASNYGFRRSFGFRRFGTTNNLLPGETRDTSYFYVMTNVPGVWTRTDYARLFLIKGNTYHFYMPDFGSPNEFWTHYTGSSVEFHLSD